MQEKVPNPLRIDDENRIGQEHQGTSLQKLTNKLQMCTKSSHECVSIITKVTRAIFFMDECIMEVVVALKIRTRKREFFNFRL